MSATPLLDWTPPEPADIRGSTFDPDRDGKRLNAQCQRVYDLMKDGVSRTLSQISFVTGDPEASISARLRDLKRFGFGLEKKYVKNGLWTYRLTVNRQVAA